MLDNESESAVKEALESLANGASAFHVRNAWRILVLTKDGIVEQGTHDELLARGGTYAQLYAKQDVWQVT